MNLSNFPTRKNEIKYRRKERLKILRWSRGKPVQLSDVENEMDGTKNKKTKLYSKEKDFNETSYVYEGIKFKKSLVVSAICRLACHRLWRPISMRQKIGGREFCAPVILAKNTDSRVNAQEGTRTSSFSRMLFEPEALELYCSNKKKTRTRFSVSCCIFK